MKKEKSDVSKKRVIFLVILVIVLILVVIAGVIFLNKYNQNKQEEEKFNNIKSIISEYFDSHNNYDSEKYLNIIDSRGKAALLECGDDLSKFDESYKEIKDEQVQEYENEAKNEMDMLKRLQTEYLDYCTTELNSVNGYEEVKDAGGLIKAEIKTTEKFAYQGNETVREKEAVCYIYNNKVVSLQTTEEKDVTE